ncbi:MAG: 4Fe-4S dicluster domain-containing protein [Clostridiales bacterium]|nr:4Fe-4S dicluster domain-containing protein [Clostridiales bacterium]
MNKINFDSEKCIGCKICYKACFIDVIRWDEENKRPYAAYPEDCVNCCYCIAECPRGAVDIDVDYNYIRQWEAIPGDRRKNRINK